MSTYAVHYNRNAAEGSQYDPMFERFDPSHARLRPLCKTRGRKDVTADLDRVTCGACLTKLAEKHHLEGSGDETPRKES